MPQNIEMEGKIDRETKNQPNDAGAGMGKGLGIGMGSCIAIGIVVSEVWGFYTIIPLSIVFGSAVGIILGTFLEKRNKKSNC